MFLGTACAWSKHLEKMGISCREKFKVIWLVVSTPLKNINKIGNLPQVGMKLKNV